MREGLAEEEVGHEDLVLVAGVGVCEDVRALERLGREAEDVVDDEDGGRGVGGTGGVALHAIEVDVFALLFVALRDGGRDITAGLAVSLLCLHSCIYICVVLQLLGIWIGDSTVLMAE